MTFLDRRLMVAKRSGPFLIVVENGGRMEEIMITVSKNELLARIKSRLDQILSHVGAQYAALNAPTKQTTTGKPSGEKRARPKAKA